eukprot:CFRG7137T1
MGFDRLLKWIVTLTCVRVGVQAQDSTVDSRPLLSSPLNSSLTNVIKLAYHGPKSFEEAQSILPELLEQLIGVDTIQVQLVEAKSFHDAVFLVATGGADMTETDADALVGMENLLETTVVERYDDGFSFHQILAVVREESPYQTFADLKGARACFNHWDSTDGMKVPIGYGIRTNAITAREDLEMTVNSFFSCGHVAFRGVYKFVISVFSTVWNYSTRSSLVNADPCAESHGSHASANVGTACV